MAALLAAIEQRLAAAVSSRGTQPSTAPEGRRMPQAGYDAAVRSANGRLALRTPAASESLWHARTCRTLLESIVFENHRQRILTHAQFRLRLLRCFVLAAAIIFASLGAGMIGYRSTEGMNWLDAFANASMILSGMGPLATPQTAAGKLFAGCYALYSGLILLVTVGIIAAPLVHRLMHTFHTSER